MEKSSTKIKSSIPQPIGGFVGVFLAALAILLSVPLLASSSCAKRLHHPPHLRSFNLSPIRKARSGLLAGVGFAVAILFFAGLRLPGNAVSFLLIACFRIAGICPLQNLARSLQAVAAMCGQLFFATGGAKIVSVWHSPQSRRG